MGNSINPTSRLPHSDDIGLPNGRELCRTPSRQATASDILGFGIR